MRAMMQEIAAVAFLDADSGEEALAIVRAGPAGIALALSLQRDGDIEVVLKPREAEALMAALGEAVIIASPPNEQG
jgi:hypothetical protein